MYEGKCYGCGLEWVAQGWAHCKACHEQFGSDSAFDRHRRAFACIPVAEFSSPAGPKSTTPRLVKHPRGYWVTALGGRMATTRSM